MIKVSDYIIRFIENLGVKHVFLISGGGNIHLIDSVGRAKKLKYVCNHHEQACAMAAEAYSRVNGNIGVCIVTTGPGGTNAITGVYGAWTDSIPLLVISGQVKREMLEAGKTVRQLGDQEINIIDLVKSITKYAVTVMDKDKIGYYLEKAVYLIKSGRQGPVWLDIPLDVQGAVIDEKKLPHFSPSEIKKDYLTDKKTIRELVTKVIIKLQKSQRPVLYIGNGSRLAHAEKELLELIDLLKIPVLTSFTGYDLVSTENPYYFGRPGTVGQRAANFILQNCDFLLTIGTRLNIRAVGYNYQAVAKGAYKVMVDIDKRELGKKTVSPNLKINCDAGEFIEELTLQCHAELVSASHNIINNKEKIPKQVRDDKYSDWLEYCRKMNIKYPVVQPEYWKKKKPVNHYCFIDALSKQLKADDVLAVSNGSACVIPYQALKFPQGFRVVVNSGCAAMGYGLPAGIGACFANQKKKTICFEGDGSIQLNLQELQTVVHHRLPLKIFVFVNNAYLSIRLTQDSLFEGKYIASDKESGVSCPNIIKIAQAYGIRTISIKSHQNMGKKIKEALSGDDPVICELILDPSFGFVPKASSMKLPDGTFVSKPLEDMWPFLSREELKENIIINKKFK
ncbi:thiamine pyrophosphate-binding protein [Candidatus Microgenomates bacterium]|nr:thiamine pyrophosphate-binding protein [Candidatus Microgenomates bacterium]